MSRKTKKTTKVKNTINKISFELKKQTLKIFWNLNLVEAVGCSTLDLILSLGVCNKAPVTGRGLLSYEKHLFPEIKNVFSYLNNKNFLDIGCGINHVYEKSLHKLQKKN